MSIVAQDTQLTLHSAGKDPPAAVMHPVRSAPPQAGMESSLVIDWSQIQPNLSEVGRGGV